MPEALVEIILRCLQSDPAERFPDISFLLQELEVLRGVNRPPRGLGKGRPIS